MLVSVIIPCYNVEAYIEECLVSVYNQTYTSIEVICVDNNSTDNTAKIILALKEKYPELILAREAKKGANAARNKGLQLAKGKWVQFLDADDLLEPEKIAHQINLTHTSERICFIAGSSYKQYLSGARSKIIVQEVDKWIALATNGLGNTCANLFWKDALLQVGGWNEFLQSSQETDLMFRLLQQGAAVYFDHKPLTIIRERTSGSISQINIVGNLERYIRLRYAVYQHLLSFKYESAVIESILQIIFNKIREVYTFDASVGLALYKEFIPSGFKPGVSSITSNYYILGYSLVGFKNIESSKALLRKLIK